MGSNMTAALSISGLKKQYDNGFQALKGINLTVAEGDFFALLGPNGAGKSTTLGIISSLVNKSSGQVKVFGVDIDEDFPKAKKSLGIVPQEFNFNQFETPYSIVVTQAGYYGIEPETAKQRAEKYLKQLGLWDKKDQPSRALSGGMKRRLMIARALVHEPKLLILDEPTAGVDIELRRSMWDFLRQLNEQGTSIILTTHYLEEAESLCRHIAIIDQGNIIQTGNMREVLTQLQQESFIFDLAQDCPTDLVLEGVEVIPLDQRCFELVLDKGQPLNPVFAQLTAKGLDVVSMRNKANRLEELFVKLLQQEKAAD